MALPSSSTSAAAAETKASRQSELSRLGGIEALDLKVGPVRRSLFGPVDGRQLQEDFRRLLCASVDSASRRWDFDFRRGRPAPGSGGGWEEVRCGDVPSFYRSRTVRCLAAAAGTEDPGWTSPADEGSPAPSTSSESGDEDLGDATGGRYRRQRPMKRRQATITDFFKVKRRRLLNYKGATRQ